MQSITPASAVEALSPAADVRRRVLLGGQVVISNGFSTINVTVKNLSDHGALLVFDAYTMLPAEFDVITKTFRRRAKINWQNDRQVDVVFL